MPHPVPCLPPGVNFTRAREHAHMLVDLAVSLRMRHPVALAEVVIHRCEAADPPTPHNAAWYVAVRHELHLLSERRERTLRGSMRVA